MKAVVESNGPVGSRVRLGDHELVFDQPTTVPGGEDRLPHGLSERQLVAVERAVKSCPAYGTLLHLPIVELEVEVDGGPVHEPLSA